MVRSVIGIAAALSASAAFGDVSLSVNDEAGFLASLQVAGSEDFNGLATGSRDVFAGSPIQLGGVAWTPNQNGQNGGFIPSFQVLNSLGDLAVSAAIGQSGTLFVESYEISFDAPVSAFGFRLSSIVDSGLEIVVDGESFDTNTLAGFVNGQFEENFLGFTSDSTIASITFSASTIDPLTPDEFALFDDFVWGSPVPAPGSAALAVVFGGAMARRRR